LRHESYKAAATLIAHPQTKAEQRNANGESALMMAALRGRLDFVQALVKRDADVNKPGWTPLHYAATSATDDAHKVVKYLLDEHAFIDAQSPNGSTSLMVAAMYGTPSSVKVLLDGGADVQLKNEQGMTALDFAEQAKRPDAIEMLKRAASLKPKLRGGNW
jgi:ankyrin repeat protein